MNSAAIVRRFFGGTLFTRKQSAPLCIAGMHRSGTSMVARLLHECGVFLGPEEELGFDSHTGEAHWENVRFVSLNDKILERLGGSWSNPPVFPAGWEHSRKVSGLKSAAKRLIKEFSDGHSEWGWKDPRNSLTLPFWRRFLPDARVIICLRNPVEVAQSIRVRGDLIGMPLFQLWATYYRELLPVPPEQRVVTHYQSYFQDPTAELQRVANAIGLEVPAEVISRACAHISGTLRHHQAKTSELSPTNVPEEVLALYLKLCQEAGASYGD